MVVVVFAVVVGVIVVVLAHGRMIGWPDSDHAQKNGEGPVDL
jgi:hypothetical protein